MTSNAAPAMLVALAAMLVVLATPASGMARKLASLPDACSNPMSFEKDQVAQNLLPVGPINLLNLPTLSSVPLDKNLLGVQFLQFNIANMGDSNFTNYRKAVQGTGKNAIFNTLGLPGTIVGSPTNAILALKRFSVNSMRVYPLFAQTMTLRFTPYSGTLLAALSPGAPVDVTISNAAPTTIYFLPRFKNITAMTISSVRIGVNTVPTSLLSLLNLGALSVNQFAIDNVCIS